MRRVTQADLAPAVSTWETRHFVRAMKYQSAGDHVSAARKYKKILDRNPRCWPAVFQAAVLAHIVCEHDWAVVQLRKLVAAVPGFLEAQYNLGTILQCTGAYAEAEQALRRVLELDSTFVAAHTNLGNSLLGLGRPDEARASFANALKFKPADAEATWNLAHVLILQGEWEKGWACYEWRFQIPGFVEMNAICVDESRADIPLPWRGASLEGKTLVVAEEQGFGDLIMTLRFAPALRALGATTVWAVRPELMRLVGPTVAPDRVVSIREPIPGSDYVVSCMTLMHRLKVRPDNIPFADGYIKVAA